LRVLVVDDHVAAGNSLAGLLNHLGENARAACSATQALVMAREFSPQLILCDLAMPGVSGYEFARRLRLEAAPSPPVLVAVTGWASDDDEEVRAREAGF